MNTIVTYVKENKLAITLILGLTIAMIVDISSFFTECSILNQELFRLHIIANSNSEYDQRVKLLVRDEILKLDNTIFQSKEISTSDLEMIKTTAQEVMLENDCELPVQVEVTNMYFTTRFYEEFTLPAGNYDALRITIGEATGENWWCVLYPPLCLPAVTHEEEVLPTAQVEIISNREKYEFKFALYEFYSEITKKVF